MTCPFKSRLLVSCHYILDGARPSYVSRLKESFQAVNFPMKFLLLSNLRTLLILYFHLFAGIYTYFYKFLIGF